MGCMHGVQCALLKKTMHGVHAHVHGGALGAASGYMVCSNRHENILQVKKVHRGKQSGQLSIKQIHKCVGGYSGHECIWPHAELPAPEMLQLFERCIGEASMEKQAAPQHEIPLGVRFQGLGFKDHIAGFPWVLGSRVQGLRTTSYRDTPGF
jgi:hypothetical protein